VIDDVRTFIEAAMAIGLGPRLEALTADVEASILTYPKAPTDAICTDWRTSWIG
jgi:hypothetical protein